MSKKYIVAVFLLSVLFSYFSGAEEPLDWLECLGQAKRHNPELVSALEKIKQAKSDKDIAVSPSLPDITADLSGKRSKSSSGDAQNSYSYGLSGKQLIFDGFKTFNIIAGSEYSLSAQQYSYLTVSSNVRLNLRKAFVSLLKAQELISLTEEIAKRRDQNFKLVKLRYEAGREHKGSLLMAEADLAKAEFEVDQAKRNLSLAIRDLSKNIGLDKPVNLRIKGDFSVKESYAFSPDFEHLVATNPFLKELIAKKESARHSLYSARAEFFPQVYLSSSIGRSSSSWPPEGDNWSLGLGVSLPLFEGKSRIAGVSKAKSKLAQAEADEKSGRFGVLATLEEAWKYFQDAGASVLVQVKFLNAAQERARIAVTQYETGLISFNDWIIIEDNLVNAKKSYLNVQAEMLLAEAYWIQAIGGTMEYD
ncbi:MAG: TolC family protein [Candidatus Omnitrophica bacterium]|nr:TolC family protein [Candidatus Omnitrophota bacterium]